MYRKKPSVPRRKYGFRKKRGFGRKQHITRSKSRGISQPDQSYVKMRKVFYGNVSTSDTETGGALIGLNHFRAGVIGTSAYTADPTSPANFLQYATQYSQFRVLGSSIKVKAVNTTSSIPVLFALYPTIHTSVLAAPPAPLDIETLLEQPYTRYREVSGAGGMDRTRLSHYMSCRKLVGHKIDEDDEFISTITYNDTEGSISSWSYPPVNNASLDWALVVQPLNGNAESITAQYIAVVDYYIRFETRTLTGYITNTT